MHITWQLHRQTTDITWLFNSLQHFNIYSTFLHVDIRSMLHVYAVDINWLFNSPCVVHFIHKCTLAVCYTFLFQIYPNYPTIHPEIVLFMEHLFKFQVVQVDLRKVTFGSTQFYNFLPCTFSCPNKTRLVECSAGSYAAAGSTECQFCPKGAFCPTKGQSTYHLCANGTYSDIEGLSDCKICDAGFRCPSVGMEAPEECPNGTYSYSAGARYCVFCPEGHRWGYHLIINLIWVLVNIDHRHQQIIQQLIHSWFHYNPLCVTQTLHISPGYQNKPFIRVVSFIHTY